MLAKRTGSIFLFFASLAMLCVAQSNQQMVKATGTVFDPNGAVIPRVSVILKNRSTPEILRTITDEEGGFVFDAVKPGIYELTAEAFYFEKFIKVVSIEDGRQNRFDPVLELHKCADPVKRLSKGQKRAVTICKLHNDPLKVGAVPIEYGLIIVADADRSRLFPNSNLVYYGGCVSDCYKKAEVMFCPVCRKLELTWRKEHFEDRK